MSKVLLFTIDLISKNEFTPESIEIFKGKISQIGESSGLADLVSEIAQVTKDRRIEIYAEDTGITLDSSEEVLSLVKLIEKEAGGFISGSCFEVGKEIPGATERWTKAEYSWESEGMLEEEKSWDEEAYWDEEWDEWNEEWN